MQGEHDQGLVRKEKLFGPVQRAYLRLINSSEVSCLVGENREWREISLNWDIVTLGIALNTLTITNEDKPLSKQ